MRAYGSLVIVLGLALPALGQEQPRRPMPPAGPGDPLQVLRDPAIRNELKLTDEQVQKVNAAVEKALTESLTPEQAKRLKQISLQLRGAEAFNDPKVQEALKLTDAQREKLRSIREEAGQQMRELFQNASGNREEAFKKMTEMRKQIQEKTLAVLTDEQKKTWKEMTGEPYEPRRGERGPRPGGERPARPVEGEKKTDK